MNALLEERDEAATLPVRREAQTGPGGETAAPGVGDDVDRNHDRKHGDDDDGRHKEGSPGFLITAVPSDSASARSSEPITYDDFMRRHSSKGPGEDVLNLSDSNVRSEESDVSDWFSSLLCGWSAPPSEPALSEALRETPPRRRLDLQHSDRFARALAAHREVSRVRGPQKDGPDSGGGPL